MVVLITVLHLFYHFLTPSFSLSPLCTDFTTPFIRKEPLGFCHYNGSVCCDSATDLQLQKQFEAMNISDHACASLAKSILCAVCDQFSAELFKVESGPLRSVPVLCNPTLPAKPLPSNKAASSFCSTFWDVCHNVSMSNIPFVASLQGKVGAVFNSSSSKLFQLWHSENIFCDVFGGSSDNGNVCFDGEQVTVNNTQSQFPPKGLCIEKISNGAYLSMHPYPDGSNRAFFAEQLGKIWLATVPQQDSAATLDVEYDKPFMDLTEEVYFENTFGLMSIAFHPNFAQNGRFFTSFNCDKVTTPSCRGKCSCNSDVSCDPTKLASRDAAETCRFHKVIAEFTANGTALEPSSEGKSAKPSEVRRILTLGLPVEFSNGGQILFGPSDGYLYVMMGDGGIRGDPYNFSQNLKSLLGKILRLDIDHIPSEGEIADLGLWGNYSVPQDNPYSEDKDLQPEIWALGLRNPWRCSFDSQRPDYFICADTGQDQYEEVDIIIKGGNYGWHVYEGPFLYTASQSCGMNTFANSANPIFPVLGYKHSDVNRKEKSAAICGGYFYRSMTDPCLYGSYLYADLYGGAIWAATENSSNSRRFTSTKIPFSCAHDSPMKCSSSRESPQPAIGYIYSFGEDNRKDIYILTSSGVYRVVHPSRCNYTCQEESSTPFPSRASYGNQFANPHKTLMLLCFFTVIFRWTLS